MEILEDVKRQTSRAAYNWPKQSVPNLCISLQKVERQSRKQMKCRDYCGAGGPSRQPHLPGNPTQLKSDQRPKFPPHPGPTT